ncbi:MAG: hypothetical protein HOB40_10480 [Candidatus Marinimicrobia bacterium]|jgi:hypothetical protein|nr:hypothetical protein [Candidatus Neomarinimicrobiota bacterium]MBT3502439.1 hypothetical protein [Candidatus Neomarinimicrobiota bacterium]MBT3838763.1 hypothetical protein [Candidatus Neomarinimicrobiota bacterium]MBT3999663.1 hypothetical protein [Candidatus Neomarinimicrobiota bacterium]MBT4578772.1 hypothetical protein [Candidatus Neomarinimicrobiota bacterium]
MVAVFWGVTPNLFSFEMLLVIQIITFEFSVGRSGLDTFPTWVFINYDISHSLFSAVIVITMVWFLNRSFAFAMLGWPFHVFFDFPFHSKAFFPPKIFWPFSEFSFDGISWDRPEIWFSNIAGIVLLFIWRYFNRPNYP